MAPVGVGFSDPLGVVGSSDPVGVGSSDPLRKLSVLASNSDHPCDPYSAYAASIVPALFSGNGGQ